MTVQPVHFGRIYQFVGTHQASDEPGLSKLDKRVRDFVAKKEAEGEATIVREFHLADNLIALQSRQRAEGEGNEDQMPPSVKSKWSAFFYRKRNECDMTYMIQAYRVFTNEDDNALDALRTIDEVGYWYGYEDPQLIALRHSAEHILRYAAQSETIWVG